MATPIDSTEDPTLDDLLDEPQSEAELDDTFYDENFVPKNLNPDDTTSYQRTQILLKWVPYVDQEVFLRGGLDYSAVLTEKGVDCESFPEECMLPISRADLYAAGYYEDLELNAFGDNFLDWSDSESEQPEAAWGSPMVWTTNDPNFSPSSYSPTYPIDGFGYYHLNDFGAHYWLFDVYMDCTATINGWFEVRAYVANGQGWEGEIQQADAPYHSNNHFAKCGMLSVFQFEDSSAQFLDITYPQLP